MYKFIKQHEAMYWRIVLSGMVIFAFRDTIEMQRAYYFILWLLVVVASLLIISDFKVKKLVSYFANDNFMYFLGCFTIVIGVSTTIASVASIIMYKTISLVPQVIITLALISFYFLIVRLAQTLNITSSLLCEKNKGDNRE